MDDDFDLKSFNTLHEAFIDASSLIYMRKAGFLQQLQESLRLYSIPEVVDEAGMSAKDFRLENCRDKHLSNDRKLLCCALERGIPLISEDRKLLMQAKQVNLPHYNSLMMLNFLLLKQIINPEEYEACRLSLRRYARYSDTIWSYGETVYHRIRAVLGE